MTLSDATDQLTKWLQASSDVATKGQSRTIDSDGVSRTFTRADAGKILEQVKYWEGRVADLAAAAASTSNGSQMIFAGRVR